MRPRGNPEAHLRRAAASRRRRHIRPYLSVTFTAIVFATNTEPLEAQESRGPTRVWVGLGLGGGKGGGVEENPVAFIAQLAFQRRPHHALLRFVFLADGGFPDGGDDNVSEVALLYGRMRSTGFGHAGVATGLASGTFHDCPGRGEGTWCHFVGIPITAEVALTARIIGIGLQGFANLNTKSIFGGLSFFIPIGWMP
jgi:hypothetical protein